MEWLPLLRRLLPEAAAVPGLRADVLPGRLLQEGLALHAARLPELLPGLLQKALALLVEADVRPVEHVRGEDVSAAVPDVQVTVQRPSEAVDRRPSRQCADVSR